MDTTKPTTPRKPRPKPARRIRVAEHANPADPEGWFAVEISLTTETRRTTRTETTVYLAREIPAGGMGAGCRGFEVEKLDAHLEPTGDVYHVLLDSRDGYSSCDCKGGAQHGHCKHSEGIESLCKAGKLPRFRSAGDFAANDPIGFEQHMASLTAGEYPDEPPELLHHADFDPRDEDIDPDPEGPDGPKAA